MGFTTSLKRLTYFVKIQSQEYGDDLLTDNRLQEAIEKALNDFAKNFQDKYRNEKYNHTEIEIKLIDDFASKSLEH
jgi:hypothetical protein